MPNVFSIVLAGGEGKRLMPLTLDRAKPAVPFGGPYRLIDFALTNLVNGGFRRIAVLTQYKSHSLDRHISVTWRMSPLTGSYVTPVPAQMRRGPHWFSGSADAIFQNLNLIGDEKPDYVIVFGADHIYRADPSQVLEQHIASGAGVTVMGIRVPIEEASAFGVIETSAQDPTRITGFHEKPTDPIGLPDAPDKVFASMGNYVFTTQTLVDAVTADADATDSKHDMGGNIVRDLVESGDAAVYDFSRHVVPGETASDHAYWRDVGTLDSYHEGNMDLVEVEPAFNLYNDRWPILTWRQPLPPAKFVLDEDDRRGRAVDSMVSEGVIISGGLVRRSVLSPGVRVESTAEVSRSVLLNNVEVGEGAVVTDAILDKDVVVEPGARIGGDHERDRARGFTISDGGIVVVGKGGRVPA
ncbi:glucose-1-phosphate adenylyltransferase [Salsipaludibacter albus]|uniref:glucose-1-phosphate adenylyltransferase n=1 Tax=Salsipaludibacter albus TaxID=2849650 RepID=UPI001EE42046|nr:glucose-1-phosphate adenylyltransferase [Salsipaludibacter albus]MBY5162693.1 glucose-1-phosphate adenylyltransferase [Salsipaludibacter albus]